MQDFLGYRKGDLRKAMLLRKNKSKRLQEVQKETLQNLSAWLIACVVGGLVIASGVAVHVREAPGLYTVNSMHPCAYNNLRGVYRTLQLFSPAVGGILQR